jgi:hypothetical protein
MMMGIGEAGAAEVASPVMASTTLVSAPEMAPLPTVEPVVAPPTPDPVTPPTVSSGTLVGNPNQDAAASAFDAKFKGTPLQGKWDVVRASAEKAGIDPKLAAAVMAHETGNGKNVSGNNPAGVMDPKSNWKSKQSFSSIDKGIDVAVKTIGGNLNRAGGDLGKMATNYAPVGAKNDPQGLNKHWLPGVRQQLKFFD